MPRIIRNPTLLERLHDGIANNPRKVQFLFASAAGAGLLALMSPASDADQPRNDSAAASTDPGTMGLATPAGADNQQCPAEMSPVIPRPDAFPFPVDPAAQQRVLQDLGFQIGRNTPDGVFKERTLTSLNELRQLYYGAAYRAAPAFSQTMSEKEYRDLAAFAAQVKRDASTYNVPVERMTNVSLAAHAFGMRVDELLPATDQGQSGFRGSMTDFLYLVKNYGHRFGMGALADQIKAERGWMGGAVSLRVDDPVAFMLLDQLRQYERTAIFFEARRLGEGNDMPQTRELHGTQPASDLARMQADLQTLGVGNLTGSDNGFGLRTEAALNLYRATYAPLVPQGANVDDYLPRFAELARRDAQTYERLSEQAVNDGRAGRALTIPTQAAAAIRLSALTTGADFGYMMKLAYAESTFDPEAGAPTSTAKGLYQFIEDTWVQTISRYGADHGMGVLARHFSVQPDMHGTMVGRSENPWMRIAALGLRDQPQLAGLMSAELQLHNEFLIECALGRELDDAELYMGHFMGHDAAYAFLRTYDSAPATNAAAAFPAAAKANEGVFYNRGASRSMAGVVELFERKFNRYDLADRPYNLQVTFNENVAARERLSRDQQVSRDAARAGFPMSAENARAMGVTRVERRGEDIVLHFDRNLHAPPPRPVS